MQCRTPETQKNWEDETDKVLDGPVAAGSKMAPMQMPNTLYREA